MPKSATDDRIAALYPRLGLTTIDSTVLRYDPDEPRFPVCFVATDREGVEIAWDICGACFTYVGICRCPNGPAEPAYMYRLRTGEPMPADVKRPVNIGNRPGPARSTLSDEAQARVDAAVADIVGTAKREVAEDRRKDAYKPRRAHEVSKSETRRYERSTPKPAAPVTPEVVAKLVLGSPCRMHTAESKLHPDGTFTCTVEGCSGV